MPIFLSFCSLHAYSVSFSGGRVVERSYQEDVVTALRTRLDARTGRRERKGRDARAMTFGEIANSWLAVSPSQTSGFFASAARKAVSAGATATPDPGMRSKSTLMPFFFRSLIAIWTPSSYCGWASGDSPTFSKALISFSVVFFDDDVVSVWARAELASSGVASAAAVSTPTAIRVDLLTMFPPSRCNERDAPRSCSTVRRPGDVAPDHRRSPSDIRHPGGRALSRSSAGSSPRYDATSASRSESSAAAPSSTIRPPTITAARGSDGAR